MGAEEDEEEAETEAGRSGEEVGKGKGPGEGAGDERTRMRGRWCVDCFDRLLHALLKVRREMCLAISTRMIASSSRESLPQEGKRRVVVVPSLAANDTKYTSVKHPR